MTESSFSSSSSISVVFLLLLHRRRHRFPPPTLSSSSSSIVIVFLFLLHRHHLPPPSLAVRSSPRREKGSGGYGGRNWGSPVVVVVDFKLGLNNRGTREKSGSGLGFPASHLRAPPPLHSSPPRPSSLPLPTTISALHTIIIDRRADNNNLASIAHSQELAGKERGIRWLWRSELGLAGSGCRRS